jgi:putative transposase
MSHSLDLRERVVGYVKEGGSPTVAAGIYKVSRSTIYRWLGREDLRPTVVKTRKRKMDWAALKEHVEQYPEAQLKDRAKQFGVQPVAQVGRSPCAVHYALRKMKITRKKRVKVSRTRMCSAPLTRSARENQIL